MQSLLVAATLIVATVAAPAGDLVTSLPGYGPPPTSWYSGYLDIDGGKHMHYIFITSPSPSTTPITAWHNGGPGCSSLEGEEETRRYFFFFFFYNNRRVRIFASLGV